MGSSVLGRSHDGLVVHQSRIRTCVVLVFYCCGNIWAQTSRLKNPLSHRSGEVQHLPHFSLETRGESVSRPTLAPCGYRAEVLLLAGCQPGFSQLPCSLTRDPFAFKASSIRLSPSHASDLADFPSASPLLLCRACVIAGPAWIIQNNLHLLRSVD